MSSAVRPEKVGVDAVERTHKTLKHHRHLLLILNESMNLLVPAFSTRAGSDRSTRTPSAGSLLELVVAMKLDLAKTRPVNSDVLDVENNRHSWVRPSAHLRCQALRANHRRIVAFGCGCVGRCSSIRRNRRQALPGPCGVPADRLLKHILPRRRARPLVRARRTTVKAALEQVVGAVDEYPAREQPRQRGGVDGLYRDNIPFRPACPRRSTAGSRCSESGCSRSALRQQRCPLLLHLLLILEPVLLE